MEKAVNQKSAAGKHNYGFTLVEIIVVLGIFAVISAMVPMIFSLILKSTNKSYLSGIVRQEGGYALSVMESLIRNAEDVSGSCQTGMTSLTILDSVGKENEFTCVDAGLGEGYIASNSARLTTTKVKLSDCSFNCEILGENSPKKIGIDFTLSQTAEGVLAPEDSFSMTFQSVVSIRNR